MKEPILKTGHWTDLYQHEGNSIYDTTESEFSSEDEQDDDQEDEKKDRQTDE